MRYGRVSGVLAAAVLLLFTACSGRGDPDAATRLVLTQIGAANYYRIAARIFENETLGQTKYLTYWGAGEDFPSLGIGHFIWFPDGVDAPFDESFPAMLQFVKQHSGECSSVPNWLDDLQPFAAPWSSKSQFDAEQQSERMILLRQWLADTAPGQARYIVASFLKRWNALDLPAAQKSPLTRLLQRLVATPRGLFAVVDYYNFKGLGSNPRERYRGAGWGLVQVLTDVSEAADTTEATDLVSRFSKAAAARLARRVDNAPPDRNEARWLEGWQGRVAAYEDDAQFSETPASQFRVTPYLHNPSATSMTIVWFSKHGTAAHVTLRAGDAGTGDTTREFESAPARACELAYQLAEFSNLEAAEDVPYRHVLKIDGLSPGQDYRYEVRQDGEQKSGAFHTPGADDRAIRFMVYGDSETEPESSGKNAAWSIPGDETSTRNYLVDQTAGYAANLDIIASRKPDFIAIAGDLVQSGGEQRDWDEFWRHNARLGATIPIVPAAGNHDYYGGPGDLGGYSNPATRRAIGKFRAYFPGQTYYALDYGPAVVIVIDANNGVPERSGKDTNWYLQGVASGGPAPAWEPDSVQAAWLEATLKRAQQEKPFTFVLFHPPPYSSGVHGRSPGVAEGENFASGIPLRRLTPMFMRYGVTAVFNGHDELYEHSVINGKERRADGSEVDHTLHFFTVGIGGDGLRGPDPDVDNPRRVFLADADAAEVFDANGILLDGGKHYGHAEVNLSARDDGTWQARIDPVYVFPVMNADGTLLRFDRRIYDDVAVIEGRHDD